MDTLALRQRFNEKTSRTCLLGVWFSGNSHEAQKKWVSRGGRGDDGEIWGNSRVIENVPKENVPNVPETDISRYTTETTRDSVKRPRGTLEAPETAWNIPKTP